jgi:hypothetical protein
MAVIGVFGVQVSYYGVTRHTLCVLLQLCNCAHLLVPARRLTHTKYAYVLLALQHCEYLIDHGANLSISETQEEIKRESKGP